MMVEPTDAASEDRISQVVGDWQNRLLQLDRRNNSYHFQPGRTAVLIADHTPDEIVARLASSSKGLKFDYVEPRVGGRGPSLFDSHSGESEESIEPHVVGGDLRSDCSTSDLQRKLGNLRRKAREWQSEQGLDVLHLALGFLRWIDEDGEEVCSPLLLLPVQLDSPTPRSPFVLSEHDDDIYVNHTLKVKLAEYGIALPELEADISDTPSDYSRVVESLIASRPNWRIEDSVYLSTFAYSKMAMWEDLDRIRTEGTNHRIVRSLAGDDAAQTFPTGTHDPLSLEEMEKQVAGGLDDLLKVRDQFAVLPADYSQLIAVAGARSGNNLVVHGPPGTGKSQTIANIIATMIAEGKTVLFVSEKKAALDVVKRRLDEIGLGVFCLDLHSERASKSSVYEQLKQSVDDSRLVDTQEFDYASLVKSRDRLNRIVRALHERRESLGTTVFQMHARFADLMQAPNARFNVPRTRSMSSDDLAEIRSASQAIAGYSREFSEHYTSHWRVLKLTSPSLELANVIRDNMNSLASATRQIRDDVASIANDLGLSPPRNCEEAVKVGEVATHLSAAPGVLGKWIVPAAHLRLRSIAEKHAEQQRMRRMIRDRLHAHSGGASLEWYYRSLRDQVQLNGEERLLIERLLGKDYRSRLVASSPSIFDSVHRLSVAVNNLLNATSEISEILQSDIPITLAGIGARIRVAYEVATLSPFPDLWLSPRDSERIIFKLDKACDLIKNLKASEDSLLSEFEESILDSVDEGMLLRYRTDHQGGLFGRLARLTSRDYRKDRNLLRGLKKTQSKMTFEEEWKSVQQVVEVSKLRKEWLEWGDQLRPVLGSRFQGRDTNWESVKAEVEAVGELLTHWQGRLSALTALLRDQDRVTNSQYKAQVVDQHLQQLRHLLDELAPEDSTSLIDDQHDLSDFADFLRRCTPVMDRLSQVVTEPRVSSLRSIGDLDALASLLEDGVRLQEIESEHEQASDDLASDFGQRFAGFDTDWTEIESALDWTGRLQVILDSRKPSDTLREHCINPKGMDYYQDAACFIRAGVAVLDETRGRLEERFDFTVTPWAESSTTLFDDILRWTGNLSADANAARDWLRYCLAVERMEKAVGGGVVSQVRAVATDAGDVPGIVERRVVSSWLDGVYTIEPLLRDFRSADQETLRKDFEELDRQLPIAARNEVRRRAFQRYPTGLSTSVKAGEMGALRGELSKQKRQLPVRRLLQRIPNLIRAIKPCFLMSPLAVSQYIPVSDLATETLKFDAVIFDEASQVFPEDAVPAIHRGKQVILEVWPESGVSRPVGILGVNKRSEG